MKKYKVLREMPNIHVGDIVESISLNITYGELGQNVTTEQLVREGWLAEVPEEKELWEKLIEILPVSKYSIDYDYEQIKYFKRIARIAHEHDKKYFADVARKAFDNYPSHKFEKDGNYLVKHIIQAIESDGEK